MKNKELADLLFPHIDKDISYYENLYPKRELHQEIVSRFAPSPTGYVHMGSLFSAFISSQFAKQTKGIFYLRIEDTDQKREIENGTELIIKDLKDFGFVINEGPSIGGDYGPYIQSERREIYQTYIKDLVSKGLAYPCFCSEEEINDIRKHQELNKNRIGYYGTTAKCRHLTNEEIKEKIKNGNNYIIRLKSSGNYDNKVTFNDLIKGEIVFPENDLDIVIMKQDGLPTYHFAHAIDDHLMHTTHVIRGDEWLSSAPVHIQLFQVLGFDIPQYAHIAPLTKKDNGGIRKLSKRKDPECSVSFYKELGIPNDVIKLYLSTVFNANFEEWYTANNDKTIDDFTFDFSKMSIGGSLFDLEKLFSISRIYFSRKKASELYQETLEYTAIHNKDFNELLNKYPDYTVNILNIEREVPRPRKDIASYSDVYNEIWYMYDELFYNDNLYQDVEKKSIYDTDFLNDYITNYYNQDDNGEVWFNKIKDVAEIHGYARETKLYKENPSKYKGSIGDACEAIRVSVTSKTMTPNLYDILKLLGKDRISKKIESFVKYIK